MKKASAVLILLALLIAVTTFLCACQPEDPPVDFALEVTAINSSVEIRDTDIESYDYTTLFSVKKDGQQIAVTQDMLDLSKVSADVGSFEVICSYGGSQAKVTVTVVATQYNVTLTKNSVTVYAEEALTYDYNSLFTVTMDGEEIAITSDMVTSNVADKSGEYSYTVAIGDASATLQVIVKSYDVSLSQTEVSVKKYNATEYNYNEFFTATVDGKEVEITADMISHNIVAEVGEYSYTVTCGNKSATLKVIVVDGNDVLVVPSYAELTLTLSQLQDYDYTMLFSLYVDGESVQVTDEMVDSTALSQATAGNSYVVTFSYTLKGVTYSDEMTVNVVEDDEVVVTTKNIVTYPNSETIELTSLFTITKGDEIIPVRNEMISGTIDYSIEGVNEIVLTYQGKTYTSTVEVRRGVIINYAASDTVSVKIGTDRDSYSFSDDFIVIVNGLRFRALDEFIDYSEVDFNQKGQYPVTITIPYNDSGVGLGGANFQYFTKTITYNVVDSEYTMSVIEEEVQLPEGTTEYNFFSNIQLVRNGYKCQVGNNIDWVNAIYVYGVLTSEIDFTSQARQLVTIDVYVNGPESQPVEISYYVRIAGDVSIVATDVVTFGDEAIFTKDLFVITENGEEVTVTYDMVSGKVDVFTPGTYYITAQYKGVTATAKVVVLNNEMCGTYMTLQRTIPQTSIEDEEGYEVGQTIPGSRLGNLIISSDGITLRNKTATLLSAIDENTLLIKWGSYEYMLYYDDGIVVLNPDNSVKLPYNDDKRPIVYFDVDKWTIEKMVVINSAAENVLSATYECYSFDAFRITDADGVSKWFAMKIELIEKTSADTAYDVFWGEVVLSDGFVGQTGEYASLTFDGVTVEFEMIDDSTGKLLKANTERPWAGNILTGTVDGKSAQILFNQYEAATFSVDGEVLASNTVSELQSMKNGGCNYHENTLFMYSYTENDGLYSYKFLLDFETMTFQLLEKDGIYGKYSTEDGNMFVFVDGYGTGIICFDASSYSTTAFSYTLLNGELKTTFTDINSLFAYGKFMTFGLADLKNVLTVKYCVDDSLNGTVFTNTHVTDGAIVEFTTTTVIAGPSCKQDIVNSIRIITKDGELTYAQKTAKIQGKYIVDTSSVDINNSGFYQIKVNIMVDGALKETYYAIQVRDDIYVGNPLVANYGKSVENGEYSLTLDMYGRAFLTAGSVLWEGFVVIADDDMSFMARLFDSDGRNITLNGTVVADGLVKVTSTGALAINVHFSTAIKQVAGSDDHVIYRLSGDDNVIYMYAVAPYALAKVVSATEENSVVTIDTGNGIVVAKVVWGNDASSGLTVADSLRGVYTCSGKDNLTIDGFGNATVGSFTGSYFTSSNSITVVSGTTVKAFELDTTAMTYTEVAFNIKESISGKQFTATHTFYYESMLYSATTTFAFNADGTVVATSVSSEFESEWGYYTPSYASKTGVKGTYSVSGNELIVKINGKSIAFEVQNVVKCKNIICKSTTISSEDIGHFSVGTKFESM